MGPGCGRRLRLIALIDEAAVIRRILRHLSVPTEIPAPRPPPTHPSPRQFPMWVVGTTTPRCSTRVPDVPESRPAVGAPEVCLVAGTHMPNEAPRLTMLRQAP